jgi:hypothetical protein
MTTCTRTRNGVQCGAIVTNNNGGQWCGTHLRRLRASSVSDAPNSQWPLRSNFAAQLYGIPKLAFGHNPRIDLAS